MDDFIREENELVAKYFNLEEVLKFQEDHDIQIVRDAGYVYACIIDYGVGDGIYATALTPMWALTHGIYRFKKQNL